jgi:hypothetical protein
LGEKAEIILIWINIGTEPWRNPRGLNSIFEVHKSSD